MSTVFNTSETAIWSRVIQSHQADLPPDVARFFLNLSFEQHDLDRMHELTSKNQNQELSEDEAIELRNLRQIGLHIDLLQSKARMTLKKTEPS